MGGAEEQKHQRAEINFLALWETAVVFRYLWALQTSSLVRVLAHPFTILQSLKCKVGEGLL